MAGSAVGSRSGGAPGGRPLGALLPGLPQTLEGRWGAGAMAMLTWIGMLTVVLSAPDRVRAAPAGGWDERLALLTLIGGLLGSWGWSWRDLGRTRDLRVVGVSQWALAVKAFSRNRTAVAGLITIVSLYLLALLTPFVAPHDPTFQNDIVAQRFLPPGTPGFLLGTDHFARDILSRLLYGARISLTIGFVAVGISVTIGTLLGAVAGYFGGLVDGVVMRFVDMVISFPRLVLLITIIAVLDASIFLIVAVLGLTLWPSTARIVRGEVLSLREREFVQAATALGYPKRRIILRHLIPNALAPVIVAATLGIGNTIVLEAGLSFLGLGVQPPTPSWGLMVASGRDDLLNAWWLSTFAGLAIVFTVLSFNLVGDGLRDALDPKLRS